MSKPKFGFADIHPEEAQPDPMPSRVDQAGERLGFTTREVPQRRRRRTGVNEPTDQLNLRASIADINRFVEWCEQERLSYREGFGRLVRLIERA